MDENGTLCSLPLILSYDVFTVAAVGHMDTGAGALLVLQSESYTVFRNGPKRRRVKSATARCSAGPNWASTCRWAVGPERLSEQLSDPYRVRNPALPEPVSSWDDPPLRGR
jgi:hypothetical protein